MTANRFSFYEEALQHNDPLWSDDLNAWLIFRYDFISHFLKDKRFTANRKKEFFEKLNIAEEEKQFLTSFYSKWLMYMDAPEHTQLRRKVQLPINKINARITEISQSAANSVFSRIPLKEGQAVIDAVSEIADPFINNVMADLLGLSVKDYSTILAEATSAVDFLWNPHPDHSHIQNAIASIKKTYRLINEIIDDERFEEDRLFDCVLKSIGTHQESLALIINIVIDGHEPFLSAIKTFMYFFIKYSSENPSFLDSLPIETFAEETLRLEIPFPYCARNANEDIQIGSKTIKKGNRVIFFISAGNVDPQQYINPSCIHQHSHKSAPLTFGAGSHYCAGAVITKKSLAIFAKSFQKAFQGQNLSQSKASWMDTFGFRTLNHLTIISTKAAEIPSYQEESNIVNKLDESNLQA
ncbi:cytochrome P450 [Bacillus velezensis]|uniref:Cytochrome P450 n=3 Tax=Bacillaceae TaxID=186817 RepID=A0AAI8HSP0_9BACI|nr:cytochrome P450 [Bacillus siamensis]MBN7743367.1 cytochrome P450 [Bacillus velezensis]NRF36577.1 cytochrome P450 [Bacillus velezensis]